MKYEVPIWEKYCLTLDEATAYFGIGINKLRECDLIQNGSLIGPAAHSGIYLNISHDTRIIEKRNI